MAATALLAGCAENTGVVEVAWVFVDRTGEPIFPGDQLSADRRKSSCNFRSTSGAETSTKYDIDVELEICDPSCADGCEAEACRVMDPLGFPCDVARGSAADVPAADAPYRFTLHAVVTRDDDGTKCSELPSECIDVPGPRERTVTAGLVTDLQVYQIKLGIDVDGDDTESRLDLEACGCA